MKIVIVDTGKPIPAKDYGGTERVIWALGVELHKMGHEIVYIVPEGSTCSFGEVISYNSSVPINNLIPENADIVHLTFRPKEKPKIPYIVTIHGNAQKGELLSHNSVFVSANHAKRHNSSVFVYNGLLWSDYPKPNLDKPRTYLHFLGKASWKIKNSAGASKVAVKSGNKLKIMGGNRWTLASFKRKPFFSLHPNVHYLGMVNDKKKIEVLENSKGLLFLVNWEEPFGLAIIESLYAGCPVFGTTLGSLPEIVHEKVGFLSRDENEIVKAIRTKSFDPNICHNYAVSNFNSQKMAKEYLNLYEIILSGKKLNDERPFMD